MSAITIGSTAQDIQGAKNFKLAFAADLCKILLGNPAVLEVDPERIARFALTIAEILADNYLGNSTLLTH